MSPVTDPGAVKRQVFVSYAHADDAPMADNSPGWVSQFVDHLQRTVLRQAGGVDIGFWMDHRLEPQRHVSDELRQRIRDSAVILVFLSPGYLASKWCLQEVTDFVAEVGAGGADNRVFLVEVLPTERERWHVALRELSPVALWTQTLARPEPRTKGWPVPDARGDRDYWDEINDLASILARQLRVLGPAASPPASGTLAQLVTPASSPNAVGDVLSIVVHAADDEDEHLVKDAQDMLSELDADPYLAPRLGPNETPAQHRTAVEQLVRSSDGVLVVYGLAPPSWVQTKHAEVRKLVALDRRATLTGLLEGPPAPKLAHGLPSRGLMVLDCRAGVHKDELGRFVRALLEQRAANANHV